MVNLVVRNMAVWYNPDTDICTPQDGKRLKNSKNEVQCGNKLYDKDIQDNFICCSRRKYDISCKPNCNVTVLLLFTFRWE